MSNILILFIRLWLAKLTRNDILTLQILKEIQMLTFDAMDAAIVSVTNKVAADKAALDIANTNLGTAQTELANAQAHLDTRTAAIVAAVA